MIRIVLDTNVLVPGMISAFGPPGRIVDRVREGHVELVVDDRDLHLHFRRFPADRPRLKLPLVDG